MCKVVSLPLLFTSHGESCPFLFLSLQPLALMSPILLLKLISICSILLFELCQPKHSIYHLHVTRERDPYLPTRTKVMKKLRIFFFSSSFITEIPKSEGFLFQFLIYTIYTKWSEYNFSVSTWKQNFYHLYWRYMAIFCIFYSSLPRKWKTMFNTSFMLL